MIIEETDKCWDFEVLADDEYFYLCDELGLDKQQAAQLVEVLQKWLAGEEVE